MSSAPFDSVWVNLSLATMAPGGAPYGLIEDAAVGFAGGRIGFAGRRRDLPVGLATLPAGTVRNGNGGLMTPGLIDCHTHLIYAGNRAREFEMRLLGRSYEEIARAGGGILSTTSVGNDPSGIAVGDGATWVSDGVDDTVSEIDAAGGVAATIPVGQGPGGIAVGDGAVWVADTLDDDVVRIDPTTHAVVTTIAVDGAPSGVAFGDGSLWVDTDAIKYSIRKAGLVPAGCDYRIVVSRKPNAPAVDGWSNCTLRSTDGFYRYSIGTTIGGSGLGAGVAYWGR